MTPEGLKAAYHHILELLKTREYGRKLVPIAKHLERELHVLRSDEDDFKRYLRIAKIDGSKACRVCVFRASISPLTLALMVRSDNFNRFGQLVAVACGQCLVLRLGRIMPARVEIKTTQFGDRLD